MYVCMYGANKPLFNSVWTYFIGVVSFVCCLCLVYNDISVFGMHIELLCLLPALPFLCLIGGTVSFDLFIISFIGNITLELYLWHEFIYRAMSQQTLLTDKTAQFLISLILSFIIAITLHAVGNKFNRTIKK